MVLCRNGTRDLVHEFRVSPLRAVKYVLGECDVDIRVIVGACHELARRVELIIPDVRIRDGVRVHASFDSKLLRKDRLQECEARDVRWKPQHHVVGAHDIVEMQAPADYVYRECIRARDVGLFGPAKTVFRRVPRDDDRMPRARIFLKEINKKPELVAPEMLAPAIAISHRDHPPRVGKAVPDLRVIAQKIGGLARARDEPYLLRDEHLDRNFSQGKKWKSIFSDVVGKVKPWQSESIVSVARARLADTFVKNPLQQSLIHFVEAGHRDTHYTHFGETRDVLYFRDMADIEYPYLPAGRSIVYVGIDNPFMAAAREYARKNNTVKHVGAAVVVKRGRVIGRGSIGAGFHGKRGGCIREEMDVPTGTQYELCEGCGYEYHSEASAIRDSKEKNENTQGGDLYLWGHWWACEPCWNAIIEADILNVYLLEGSEKFFNKAHPDNIIGQQFT